MKKTEELKRCSEGHIWMANTPVCPYCNYSPEARIAHLREKKKK